MAVRQAAYCGTRNLYDDMETAAKSLIANSGVEVVHMLCEDADMGRDLPKMVQVHDVHQQRLFRKDGPNMQSCFTYMAMMRVALCHIIDGIWDLPIDDCYFAATHEWHKSEHGLLYCNFGVVLYNLDRMRDGKADEIVDVLNRRQYTWVEQDVGNYLCQGRIYDMPSKYNSNWWTDKNASGALIRHFAGVARDQWVNDRDVREWREMPWPDVLFLHERFV